MNPLHLILLGAGFLFGCQEDSITIYKFKNPPTQAIAQKPDQFQQCIDGSTEEEAEMKKKCDENCSKEAPCNKKTGKCEGKGFKSNSLEGKPVSEELFVDQQIHGEDDVFERTQ
jgi:hypothetical protein